MSILKSNILVGITAGLTVTVLAPVLLPVLASAGRPLAKSLVKSGLLLYEKGREAVAGAGESMEDMLAEIRAEEAEQATPRTASETRAAQPPAASAERQPRASAGAPFAEGGDGPKAAQAGAASA